MEPRAGKEDEHLVGLARKLGVDLIVVESRGVSGIEHALVGSVSESIVRYAHCPVLVMRH
jgi:nucleotide-binding universal stress UspA family protein